MNILLRYLVNVALPSGDLMVTLIFLQTQGKLQGLVVLVTSMPSPSTVFHHVYPSEISSVLSFWGTMCLKTKVLACLEFSGLKRFSKLIGLLEKAPLLGINPVIGPSLSK